MRMADDLRAYLLDEMDADRREAIEASYFADPAALDRLDGAEQELIEAYLAGQLDARTRARFEQTCLTTPTRRQRLDTTRRLMSASPAAAPASPRARWTPYLALAASLLIFAAAGWWMRPFGARTGAGAEPSPVTTGAARPSLPAPPPEAAPSVLALALSPLNPRGPGATPALILPPGIATLRLDLEAVGSGPGVSRPHAMVQTVDGAEVWRGEGQGADGRQGWTVAVPAARLMPDDYVLVLLDPGRPEANRELFRYFFRIRAR